MSTLRQSMLTRVVRSLLVVFGLGCVAACGAPAPATAASTPTTERDREIAREQRALDSGHLRLQNRVLSDLQKLREGQAAPGSGAAQPSRGATKLLVFGGASHEVYLGCLCDNDQPESVFNLSGEYGSGLSRVSLRNKLAPYGSKHEDTSVCNAHATHPPSVVASDGRALGLLTLNASLKKRIAAPSVTDWLARLCQH